MPGPDFDGLPADLDGRLDAAEERFARPETLAEEAVGLSEETLRL